MTTVFVVFFVLLVTSPSTAAGRTGEPVISGSCNSITGEVAEFRENESPTFTCYGSSLTNTDTVKWDLENTPGGRLALATCYGVYNCTTTYNSSLLRVNQSNSFYTTSTLTLYNIGRQFSGALKCTKTLKNGATNFTTCRIRSDRVRLAAYFEIPENSYSRTVTCNHVTTTPSVVSWNLRLRTSPNQNLDLGSCSNIGSCTSTDLHRFNSITHLTMRSYSRDKAGQITCSFSYNGQISYDTAELHFYRSNVPQPANCTADLQATNWTLVVSCDVQGLYSTTGLYTAELYNSKTWLERQSVTQYLTRYTDTDGRESYRGRVSYNWKLPAVAAKYSYFQLRQYCGYQVQHSSSMMIIPSLIVATPGKLFHNCSELSHVPQTGRLHCVCGTDNLGSPAGRLKWLLGDITVATGDYGVNTLEFPKDNFSGMVTAVCQLDWIQTQIIFVKIRYGNEENDALNLARDERDRLQWIAVVLGIVLAVAVIIIVVVVLRPVLCGRKTARSFDTPKKQPGTGEGTARNYDKPTQPATGEGSLDSDNYDVVLEATDMGTRETAQSSYENTSFKQ